MFVKPADGRLIRDPRTLQPLPPDGREVPEDAFWLQLERHGDVVRTEAAPEPASEPEPPEPDQAEPVAEAPHHSQEHQA